MIDRRDGDSDRVGSWPSPDLTGRAAGPGAIDQGTGGEGDLSGKVCET